MKIRIIHLDIDPRQIHELAVELGSPLPPSALAPLTPQQRDCIVQRWEQRRNWGRGGSA